MCVRGGRGASLHEDDHLDRMRVLNTAPPHPHVFSHPDGVLADVAAAADATTVTTVTGDAQNPANGGVTTATTATAAVDSSVATDGGTSTTGRSQGSADVAAGGKLPVDVATASKASVATGDVPERADGGVATVAAVVATFDSPSAAGLASDKAPRLPTEKTAFTGKFQKPTAADDAKADDVDTPQASYDSPSVSKGYAVVGATDDVAVATATTTDDTKKRTDSGDIDDAAVTAATPTTAAVVDEAIKDVSKRSSDAAALAATEDGPRALAEQKDVVLHIWVERILAACRVTKVKKAEAIAREVEVNILEDALEDAKATNVNSGKVDAKMQSARDAAAKAMREWEEAMVAEHAAIEVEGRAMNIHPSEGLAALAGNDGFKWLDFGSVVSNGTSANATSDTTPGLGGDGAGSRRLSVRPQSFSGTIGERICNAVNPLLESINSAIAGILGRGVAYCQCRNSVSKAPACPFSSCFPLPFPCSCSCTGIPIYMYLFCAAFVKLTQVQPAHSHTTLHTYTLFAHPGNRVHRIVFSCHTEDRHRVRGVWFQNTEFQVHRRCGFPGLRETHENQVDAQGRKL